MYALQRKEMKAVRIFILNAIWNQNQIFNCNKNRNNNGNNGRYRKPSGPEDLKIETRRDSRGAREQSSAAKQETGSGERRHRMLARQRLLFPVKVSSPSERLH